MHPIRWALGLGTISTACLQTGPVLAADCPFNGRRTMFPDLPCHDIAAGPGIAYFRGNANGYAPTLDVAYSYEYFAASVNLGYVHEPGRTLYLLRSEFSYWMLANWGAGFGYAFGREHGPVAHLFAGFPFGDNHTFVEPYYRLNFLFFDRFDLAHEAGLMLKLTTYKI